MVFTLIDRDFLGVTLLYCGCGIVVAKSDDFSIIQVAVNEVECDVLGRIWEELDYG
jgi:hypothetical protein